MILFENKLIDLCAYVVATILTPTIVGLGIILIDMFGKVIGGGIAGFIFGFCWCVRESIEEYWGFDILGFPHFFSFGDDAFQSIHIFGTFMWYSVFFAFIGIGIAFLIS